MNKEQWNEFRNSCDTLLENLVPELSKHTSAVICYSFLNYLAATCVCEKNEKLFEKFLDKKHEDCLDFFHHQLDILYDCIKRGQDGQTD
jgi:hypothetical protein